MRRRKNIYQSMYEAINQAEEAVIHVVNESDIVADEDIVKKELENLIANEVCLSETSGALMDSTSALSAFDIGMAHISQKLMQYARNLSTLSDSNLAVV